MAQTADGSSRYWLIIMAALALLVAAAGAHAAPDKSDVRVLIDISGSMHQNDPDNLRRPALRMLAGLLQPGTRAGVWTFARWVNNLVPVADVDAAWKKRTQSLSQQISSPGQFTNIEDVLERASRDWSGEPTTHARHLVLLTDGMVDVSKKAGENAQSRARILKDLLPRMKAAGVKVHTIALSERADHELMQQLAGETGGWYQQIGDADELQRAFLRMFETVGKPDSVPLEDNRFVVDGSISEATVLVFSKPAAPPVVLRSPDGEEFTDSDLPSGVAWSRDQGYDLITIARPQKGEWRLQADIDPDNRVMIVTDLKLQTSELPTYLAVGEQLRIEAHLSNEGKLVDRQAFLRLLEVRADAISDDGTYPQGLNDQGREGDAKAGDGRYSMQFLENRQRDAVELLVSVDSPTFMREKRFRLAIQHVADGVVEGDKDALVLKVKANTAVMQPGVEVMAWQQDATGQRLPLQPAPRGDERWTGELMAPALPVYVTVNGTTRLGNRVEREFGPIMPPGVEPPKAVEPAPVVEAPQKAEEPPAVEAVPEPVVAPEVQPDMQPEPTAESDVEEEAAWVMPAIMFGGFNLLLLIGAGVWFFLRRRRAKGAGDDDLDLEGLMDDAAGGTADEARDESGGDGKRGEAVAQENAA